MKKINVLGYLSMALIFLFISCDQQGEIELLESSNSAINIDKSKQILLQPTTLSKSEIDEVSCGESKVVTLTAGQHIDVGTVTVSNDETNLYVVYETTGNWVITETHLYVGPEAGIPLNGGGNPRIGHFPYHGNDDSPFTIPLAGLGDDFVIVAHAVVKKVIDGQTMQSETAFGCGEFSFPGNRWGCYFDYDKKECDEEDCMIVFGKKDIAEYTSCMSYDIDGSDYWGWSSLLPSSLLFNPNLQGDLISLPIYRNINNCDDSNKIQIGRVEFYAFENNGSVGFNISFYIFNIEYGGPVIDQANPYKISEINVYVGPEQDPFNEDGSLKANINNYNFYNQEFDTPIKRTDPINMVWTGETDLNTKVYIIPYAKVCK